MSVPTLELELQVRLEICRVTQIYRSTRPKLAQVSWLVEPPGRSSYGTQAAHGDHYTVSECRVHAALRQFVRTGACRCIRARSSPRELDFSSSRDFLNSKVRSRCNFAACTKETRIRARGGLCNFIFIRVSQDSTSAVSPSLSISKRDKEYIWSTSNFFFLNTLSQFRGRNHSLLLRLLFVHRTGCRRRVFLRYISLFLSLSLSRARARPFLIALSMRTSCVPLAVCRAGGPVPTQVRVPGIRGARGSRSRMSATRTDDDRCDDDTR